MFPCQGGAVEIFGENSAVYLDNAPVIQYFYRKMLSVIILHHIHVLFQDLIRAEIIQAYFWYFI